MAYFKLGLFSIVTCILIFLAMLIIKYNVKDRKKQDLFFVIGSVLTLLIHYSILIVNFSHGDYYIADNMFLPVYPCNVMMWVNVILCFLIIKKGKVFDTLATFSLYCGSMCGIIGLCFNKNYLNNPSLLDYDILKGLISHGTLIFSSMYLGIFGYVRIKTLENLKGVIIGAIILAVCSFASDVILELMGREKVNGMLLVPLEGKPFASFYMISVAGLILYFASTSIYEHIVYKDEAWFRHLGRKDLKDERSTDQHL